VRSIHCVQQISILESQIQRSTSLIMEQRYGKGNEHASQL
jgi:hypothetical protein